MTLDWDPNSPCESSVPWNIFSGQVIGGEPGSFTTWSNWSWLPDDPPIGDASLTCTLPPAWSPGNPLNGYLRARVDNNRGNLVCTISDTATTPSTSFVSTAAPVRDGAAVAFLQLYPAGPTTAGKHDLSRSSRLPRSSRRARDEIVLRDRHGHVQGQTKATIVWGHARAVAVPVDRAVRKRVAKKGFVKVTATLKRVDGKPGTGDRAKLTVMKDHSSLPF